MASSYDGHVSKRQRTENGGRGISDTAVDRHNPEASIVVHVRGLPDYVTEEEIVNAVQHFGPVEYVKTMPRRHQALVEFRDLNGSKACVNFTSTNQLYISGQPAYFNFSTSPKIQRQMGEGIDEMGARIPVGPNNILLFTVLNAQYPITVEVMHTICSSHGTIEKIVIFKKHHVQSMVQFDSVDAAKRAKDQLNGCDVYSGCCTLKIEFAKTDQLNVRVNNSESWDYTLTEQDFFTSQDIFYSGVDSRKNPPLLADPRYTAAPTPYSEFEEFPDNKWGAGGSGVGRGYATQYGGEMGYDGGFPPKGVGRAAPIAQQSYGGQGRPGLMIKQEGYTSHGRGETVRRDSSGYGAGGYSQGFSDQSSMGGTASPQTGCVLMVYGLNPELMNCDNLFNLLCLYGNVVRVKFLKTKEGSAMVQMGDPMAVERAMYNLGQTSIFNNKLVLTPSKQPYLQEVQMPHTLPDQTSSYKDFSGNRNNRFSTPESAAKNRIMHPTEILHYFNAPPKVSEEELKQIFLESGAKAPTKVLQFANKSDKSSTGLLEWDNQSDAAEALTVANHCSIPNPGGRPYVMKLCFSQNNIRDTQA